MMLYMCRIVLQDNTNMCIILLASNRIYTQSLEAGQVVIYTCTWEGQLYTG